MPRTPVTPEGMEKFDHLPPVVAVLRAWTEHGAHPDWHAAMRTQVRDEMPLLGRALDRLAAEAGGR